jgi:hypothetical protein
MASLRTAVQPHRLRTANHKVAGVFLLVRIAGYGVAPPAPERWLNTFQYLLPIV